jgi:hypothetical protein
VLFGGRQRDGGYPNDVWEFDGTAWSSRATQMAPAGRQDHGLASHSQSGAMVLFGGNNGSYLNDTWTLTGDTWQRSFTSSTSPVARDGHVFVRAVDSLLGDRLVLFGGRTSAIRLNDTWEWKPPVIGATWSERNSSNRPAARSGATAIWEPRRVFSRVVVFGGLTDTGRTNEVLVLEGGGSMWAPRPVMGVIAPSARSSHGAAYDPDRMKMLVFGGTDGGTLLDDVWEWSEDRWTPRPVANGPSPRGNVAMAWHPTRRAAVVFGGELPDGGVTDETWLLEVVTP